jgi:hypothetical protein
MNRQSLLFCNNIQVYRSCSNILDSIIIDNYIVLCALIKIVLQTRFVTRIFKNYHPPNFQLNLQKQERLSIFKTKGIGARSRNSAET